jgi:Homing endonuclease associated repeat
LGRHNLMNRDAILAAIRAAARKLGRAPTRSEFTRLSGISHFKVLAHFPSLREAVLQAGFEPNPQGLRISSLALLDDWARDARKLRSLPSRSQYLRHGRYSAGVFTLRFGSWTAVPQSFRRFAGDNHLEEEWIDVVGLIHGGHNQEHAGRDGAQPRLLLGQGSTPVPGTNDGAQSEARRGGATYHATSLGSSFPIAAKGCDQATCLPPPLAQQRCVTRLVLKMIVNTLAPQDAPCNQLLDYQLTQLPDALSQLPDPPGRLFRDRPLLGPPLSLPGLGHEPMNETGVVFLFGMLAHRLGFQVESLQAGFPDCEAARQIQPGKWQRVRIEFEFESRNFLTHRHPPEACDVIVCWRHNWLECPNHLEVVELRKVLERP